MNLTLIQKLRYMGRQYAAGQAARGGGNSKHYLQEAADAIESRDSEIAALRAELEALRAQVERLKSSERSAWNAAFRLDDEVERLRVDAGRYRWLRDRCPWTMCSTDALTRIALRLPVSFKCRQEDADEFDAAIDAAMREEQKR